MLALDIGGTKLAAALVDPTGAFLTQRQVPTPRSGDPEAVFGALVELALRTRGEQRIGGVGVGSAGPLDVLAGTVSPLNIPAWRAFALVGRLAERLAAGLEGPVRLAGDGQCFALGEHWLGGHGDRALLAMIVSTGVGGGLVLDGTVLRGATGNAGHVGHMVVEAGGEVCVCGGTGCVEMYASGPNLVRWARSQGWRPGEPGADAARLAADAAALDPVALAAFDRAARAIAAVIVSTAALTDRLTVVIGGGVSQAGEILLGPLRLWLGRLAGLDFLRDLPVHTSRLGLRASLGGSAALVLEPRVVAGRTVVGQRAAGR
ncbi:ROK family protein [Kitasatospora nipponensis]|uniref:ROK family protein n=1 Tax=Kitasatospora nipponensis TaxID=258049 RepID=A0ABP4HPX1_9ACTN